MQFKSGMLGTCIVVLSLLATVLLGYSLGVDETTESRTSYNSITNITSQFSYTEGSSYVEYNPALNYTGYTAGTIDFTSSGTANQYTVIKTPGTHYSTSIDLSDTAYYSTSTHSVDSKSFTGEQSNWWLVGGYIMSVADILSYNSIDYTTLEGGVTINLLYGTPYNFSDSYYADPNLVTARTSSTFNSYSGTASNQTYVDNTGTSTTLSSLGVPWYWASAVRPYYNADSQTASFTVFVAKSGETRISLNGTVTDISDVSSTYICWSDTVCYTKLNGASSLTSGGPWNGGTGNYADEQVEYLSENSITPTNFITIDYDVGAVVDYMRISDGVSFVEPTEYAGSDTVYTSTWANGQTNAAVSWLIHFDDLTVDSSMIIDPQFTNASSNAITLQVSTIPGSGTVGVYYTDYVGDEINQETFKDIGAWNNILLTFDSVNRTVTVTPVTSFSNFQNYTLSGDSITVQDGFPAYGSVDDDLLFGSVLFTVPGDGMNEYTFSVVSTTVYMGYNKAIFVNATLNPRTLFLQADYPILRISFDSVALYGSAVILNGTSYPVSNGMITIGANRLSVSGLSVTYMDDGHIYAGKESNDIDLGEATDNTITMEGQWYFQARASNGYADTVDVVDWDVGHWAVSMQQALLVFEACLVAGIIIAHHKKSLATLDWVILIIAGFGGAVLFV